jgi:tRNA U34 5-methylaminomethyl-2-thiouridine-forming methyltransferase MnmC
MNTSKELIITEDGTHTLISTEFGVAYHSVHGALEETQKVFIEMGLMYKYNLGLNKIRIFEMGFGSGLNALCTLMASNALGVEINYTTIEAYPLLEEEVSKLNFIEKLDSSFDDEFNKMHSCKSGEHINFNKMSFKKFITPIEEWMTNEKFDVIFYDAFAPASQPHLWEAPIMQKMYDILEEGGVLCTYCAKGSFKRVLKEVGFKLQALPGPGRKREITRASK